MTQLNLVCLTGTCGISHKSVNFNRFTLATNLVYRDKEGNAVIETTWHNVVADKTLACPQKGDKVLCSEDCAIRSMRPKGANGATLPRLSPHQ